MAKRRNLIVGSTSSDHSPASELIACNVDLLSEILFRLPPKSLIRFKSVSKDWFSLISNSQFSQNHSLRNPKPLFTGLYLHIEERFTLSIQSLSLNPHHSSLPSLSFLNCIRDGWSNNTNTTILHSCNGLLLCLNGTTRFIVCNPTTKKHKILPYPVGISSSCFVKQFSVILTESGPIHNNFGAYLAFDPSKSPHYKVVLVTIKTSHYSHYSINIYSSESVSWKHVPVAATHFAFVKGVFWNGAIHWVNYKNVHFQFDIEAEKLIEIPMNPIIKRFSHTKVQYFLECSGHLFLVQNNRPSALGFKILQMVMDRNGYNWVVKHRVNLRPLRSVFPELADGYASYAFSVLCVLKGAKKNDFAFVLATPGRVILCNKSCKRWKVLRDFPPNHRSPYYGYAYGYQFIESLSPISDRARSA